ncbi:MAG: YraN family protein [Cardiobacterium sp.]
MARCWSSSKCARGARAARVSAAASITPAKQAKIRKTALAYLQQHHPQPPDCRFDAVCIDGAQITWLKGIF